MTQALEQQDMALFIDALARRDADPLTRFVRSLSDDPRLSANYAAWITKHAHEVAYRWSSLMRSVQRWSMYDAGGPVRVEGVNESNERLKR